MTTCVKARHSRKNKIKYRSVRMYEFDYTRAQTHNRTHV